MMKRNWKAVCAGLAVISLLASCAGTSTAGPASQNTAQGVSVVGSSDATQGVSVSPDASQDVSVSSDSTHGVSVMSSAFSTESPAEEIPAAEVPAGPQETLEEVFKNHDAYTDTLSKWNAKAEKKKRSAWALTLTPEQEQSLIDSMNADFKKAVLEKAYEDLKNAEPWDEESLFLKALLDHDLISSDKAEAFLLARALYAKNLERALWEDIQKIVAAEKEKNPDYFPVPENPYTVEEEDSMLYESAVSDEGIMTGAAEASRSSIPEQAAQTQNAAQAKQAAQAPNADQTGYTAPDEHGTQDQDAAPPFNTAEYNVINENPFKSVSSSPLSTFSIDVDTAGYTKLKYDILDGYEIEKDEVKIEEMINYFNYDYSGSRTENEPFTISTEYTRCPWNEKHGLIRIGVLADDMQEKPATNFVIVVDVSGSMMMVNKLPLALSAYADMLEGFDGNDTISLMYYASGQDVILKNVKCDKKEEIFKGLANVLGSAGGGTYGALGLQTAYEMAEKSYAENGVNRVLIATDGDFNIGETSEGDLKGIVEEGRKKGVYLTILGYGSENLKDNKMEVMAENGNGNYHYIGDMADARKALVQESSSTLIPMADDVKIQVEFNPAFVQDYRLIGYESRILNAEDFNNDKVDAGDVGAGKSVTALYEIVPAGEEGETDIPDLKYSRTEATGDSKDLCTVAVRYKDINSGKTGSGSRLVEKAVLADDYHETPDANTALAISLAEAGMVIRDSEFKGTATLTSAEAIARAAASESGNELASSWAELLHTLIEQSE